MVLCKKWMNTHISLSAVEVPRFPKSFPQIPFRSVYILMFGISFFVAKLPKNAMIKYAQSWEPVPGPPSTLAFCNCCSSWWAGTLFRAERLIHPITVGMGLSKRGIKISNGGISGTSAKRRLLALRIMIVNVSEQTTFFQDRSSFIVILHHFSKWRNFYPLRLRLRCDLRTTVRTWVCNTLK